MTKSKEFLFELSANAGDFADAIIASYKNLAILNFVFAKANLAYNMRASMPIMNDRGIVDLKQARHPIIDKDKVVPVDIVLGKNFDTLVITGPNTGGKTVTIKNSRFAHTYGYVRTSCAVRRQQRAFGISKGACRYRR